MGDTYPKIAGLSSVHKLLSTLGIQLRNNVITAISEEDGSASEDLIEHQRALVKRVVSSSFFVKSERLTSFLICVCELTFNGKADQINEQKIGTVVFGRRPAYDSATDGIVRTQASRLRQRLETYFSTEGADEALLIVMPRGGYVPLFQRRVPELQSPASLAENPDFMGEQDLTARTDIGSAALEGPGEPPQSVRVELSHMLPWVVCGFLILCLIAILVSRGNGAFASHSSQSSIRNPLWQHLFSAPRPTLLVPADSGLVLFEGMTKREASLNDYIRGDYRTAASSSDALQTAKTSAANARYTSIVDLEMAVGLSRTATELGTVLNIRYARDLRPNDLKSTNVVLSGAAQANPWVRLFEPHMNFVLQNDPNSDAFFVMNRSPEKGEPAHWESALTDPERRVYGVVAFLPNLTGDGEVLILEGTSMSGTEAAWDFVSDDTKLLPFLKRIKAKNGNLPHFEVLIGTNNMGSSAVESSALAWRVLK